MTCCSFLSVLLTLRPEAVIFFISQLCAVSDTPKALVRPDVFLMTLRAGPRS